jgi:hypothetical protein
MSAASWLRMGGGMADSVSLGLVGSCCEAVLPMFARDWMTVILPKSCAKPLRVSGCFFRQSLHVEAARGRGRSLLSITFLRSLLRRTQMNRIARTLVDLAGPPQHAGALSRSAQPRGTRPAGRRVCRRALAGSQGRFIRRSVSSWRLVAGTGWSRCLPEPIAASGRACHAALR